MKNRGLNEINFEELSELDDELELRGKLEKLQISREEIDMLIRRWNLTKEEKDETTRFLVKYKSKSTKNTSSLRIQDKVKSITQVNNKALNMRELDIIETNEKMDSEKFAQFLEQNSMTNEIEFFQPDYELSIASFDPYFGSQWGLHGEVTYELLEEAYNLASNNIYSEENNYLSETDILNDLAYNPISINVLPAWDLTLGTGTVIGLLDTGVDTEHPDLKSNIWTNKNEIPENDIDDDNNRFTDDFQGWNFVDNTNEVHDTQRMYDEYHGTALAGIIGAVKDNEIGIAGTSPEVKILPLKVFRDGKAYTSDIIEAINYCEQMGVKIINASWGSNDNNPALEEAIKNSSILFVAAAGNSGKNIDEDPVYPASYNFDNVITVGSINMYGYLSAFSNYGTSVDVTAPGENILSTAPNASYSTNSGTSFAAAFVSGLAALILSHENNLTALEIKQRIINTSDKVTSLYDKINNGRKVNCSNALYNVQGKEIFIPDKQDSNEPITLDSSQDGFELFSLTGIQDISAGTYLTLALKSDGTVWSWGMNDYGQLGNGTNYAEGAIYKVQGLDNVVSVAAGSYHGLALKNDGTVWSWGGNNYGQLGDGTTTNRYIPVQVQNLNNVIEIAAGQYYSIALKSDGTVWAWGLNNYGVLGDGTSTSRYTPVQVHNLSNVIAISAGDSHNLALRSNGTVWAWGNNNGGVLGDGTTQNRYIPIQVKNLNGVLSIAAGSRHSMALKSDETVWTWGYNNYGQLGNGTSTDSYTPLQVQNISNAVSIDAGYDHSMALKSDGTVWSWGDNSSGQLGDNTYAIRHLPVQVQNLESVAKISAGDRFSIALDTSGIVYGWGNNFSFQIGKGSHPISLTAKRTPFDNIKDVKSGYQYSIFLKNDGNVWSCGYNSSGQLGDGTTTDKYNPVQMQNLNNIVAISAGMFHSLALKSDGTVWSWGSNFRGQLGDGTTLMRTTPVKVENLNNITAIASGYFHNIALKNDGTVWTWGYNNYGQLGDGTTITKTVPVQVQSLNDVTSVAAGDGHSIALKADGTVWSWGNNGSGQLGDRTITKRNTPVQVAYLNDVYSVTAGNKSSAAIKDDGTLLMWGDNYYGQLGYGNRVVKTASALPLTANTYIQTIKSCFDTFGNYGGGPNGYSPEFIVSYLSMNMGIIKFDLSAIPSNANIISATFRAYMLSESSGISTNINKLYRLNDSYYDDFTENEIFSWMAHWPAMTNLHEVVVGKDEGWKEWSNDAIKDTVQGWVDGSIENRGFVLGPSSTVYDSFNRYYYSKEYMDGSFAPELVIEYTISSGLLKVEASIESRDWETDNIYVDLTYINEGDGGVGTKQFAWSTSTNVPTSWNNYTGTVSQSTDGIWYLHYKISDTNGNYKTGYFGPYKKRSGCITNVDISINNTYNFVIYSKNITDYSQYTFTVIYDQEKLEVIDLCGITYGVENAPGTIDGTDITITNFSPGQIEFTFNKNISSGYARTGVVNIIKFKAKANGQTEIEYRKL